MVSIVLGVPQARWMVFVHGKCQWKNGWWTGVLPFTIHFDRIFPYNPTCYWGYPAWNPSKLYHNHLSQEAANTSPDSSRIGGSSHDVWGFSPPNGWFLFHEQSEIYWNRWLGGTPFMEPPIYPMSKWKVSLVMRVALFIQGQRMNEASDGDPPLIRTSTRINQAISHVYVETTWSSAGKNPCCLTKLWFLLDTILLGSNDFLLPTWFLPHVRQLMSILI